MDDRHELRRLEEPDPRAVERVWTRFEQTRAARRWPTKLHFGLGALGVAGAAAAALALVSWPESARSLRVDSIATESHSWSPQVQLEMQGRGSVAGTDRDVTIEWLSGTLDIEVEPRTGTQLQVVTDEARVEVIGTVLSVTRDATGVRVGVDKGRIRVTCRDGWAGELTPENPPHTCLPVTPAGLLARADALVDRGVDGATVLATLDRGVDLATAGSPVMGELLVRRMRQRATLDVDGALEDAERYLATDAADRATEVRRFAGWLALSERGCDAAETWLTELHEAGSVEETVLLAECIAAREPDRARRMLLSALPALDGEWSARATQDLAAMMERQP